MQNTHGLEDLVTLGEKTQKGLIIIYLFLHALEIGLLFGLLFGLRGL